MRILVDLDGTIANWGAEWDKHATPHIHLGLPLTADQQSFDLYKGLDDEGKARVNEIMNHPGFYANLVPFDGAVEALNKMLAKDHDVRILTAPWITNATCASDKYDWVEKYIGEGWGKRTILSSDKTLVRGDILIDDKPEITGDMMPTWTQVFYDQPYNRGIIARRINNWTDGEWEKTIDTLDVIFKAIDQMKVYV